MKALVILCTMLVSLFIISCNKDRNEPVQPSNDTPVDTAGTSWEQLPEELKNAPTDTVEENNEAARIANTVASPLYPEYRYPVGPWGPIVGQSFSHRPPNGSTLYAIGVYTTLYINRIVFWYRKANGTLFQYGEGQAVGTLYTRYFARGEYIKRVSGRYTNRITMLVIYKNTNQILSFGRAEGNSFNATVANPYQILGFYGRSGPFINQIGFHVYTR